MKPPNERQRHAQRSERAVAEPAPDDRRGEPQRDAEDDAERGQREEGLRDVGAALLSAARHEVEERLREAELPGQLQRRGDEEELLVGAELFGREHARQHERQRERERGRHQPPADERAGGAEDLHEERLQPRDHAALAVGASAGTSAAYSAMMRSTHTGMPKRSMAWARAA